MPLEPIVCPEGKYHQLEPVLILHLIPLWSGSTLVIILIPLILTLPLFFFFFFFFLITGCFFLLCGKPSGFSHPLDSGYYECNGYSGCLDVDFSLNSIEFALTNELLAFPPHSTQTCLSFSHPHPIQFHSRGCSIL